MSSYNPSLKCLLKTLNTGVGIGKNINALYIATCKAVFGIYKSQNCWKKHVGLGCSLLDVWVWQSGDAEYFSGKSADCFASAVWSDSLAPAVHRHAMTSVDRGSRGWGKPQQDSRYTTTDCTSPLSRP